MRVKLSIFYRRPRQALESIELSGEDAINIWAHTRGNKVGNEDNCVINYSYAYCHESQSGCVDGQRFTNACSIAINAHSTTFKIVYVSVLEVQAFAESDDLHKLCNH